MTEFEAWAKQQPIPIWLRRHHVDEHQYASLFTEWCSRAYIAGVAAGREQAAKVCEGRAASMYDHAKGPYLDCAAAIRSRE